MNHNSERAEIIIAIESADSLVKARQTGKDLALGNGFPQTKATLIAAAISELARNIIQFAGRGEIRLRCDAQGALHVVASDNGAGIADVRKALEPGYSTADGLGLGLPGVQRIADDFQIKSGPQGTTVTIAMKAMQGESLLEIERAPLPSLGEIPIGDRCPAKRQAESGHAAADDGSDDTLAVSPGNGDRE